MYQISRVKIGKIHCQVTVIHKMVLLLYIETIFDFFLRFYSSVSAIKMMVVGGTNKNWTEKSLNRNIYRLVRVVIVVVDSSLRSFLTLLTIIKSMRFSNFARLDFRRYLIHREKVRSKYKTPLCSLFDSRNCCTLPQKIPVTSENHLLTTESRFDTDTLESVYRLGKTRSQMFDILLLSYSSTQLYTFRKSCEIPCLFRSNLL